MAGAYVEREAGRGPFARRPWTELTNGFMVGRGDPGLLHFVWLRDRLFLLHGGFKCVAQHSHSVVKAPDKQGPLGPREGNSH